MLAFWGYGTVEFWPQAKTNAMSVQIWKGTKSSQSRGLRVVSKGTVSVLLAGISEAFYIYYITGSIMYFVLFFFLPASIFLERCIWHVKAEALGDFEEEGVGEPWFEFPCGWDL